MSAGGPLRMESLCDAQQGVAARQAGLPPPLRQLHRRILRAFLAPDAEPHLRDFSSLSGVDQKDMFRQLIDADLVHLDGTGYIRTAYPFSGQATGHLVHLDDGLVLHAMCAIDALGIPLMIGRDAVITSADVDDQNPIRVERRGDSWRWSPDEAAVLVAQRSGDGPAAECLCPSITFHASPARAETHLRRHAELTGRVLTQNEAVDVARQSFQHLLAPEAGAPTIVELLHTDACPNALDYLPHLQELVAGYGVVEPIRLRLIATSEQAQRERFLGSPTIRVNGRDVDPAAAERRNYGLSCRLYPAPDGLRGTPPDHWITWLLDPDQPPRSDSRPEGSPS